MGKYIFLFFTICIHGCSMHKSINFILDDNTMITINNKKCDRSCNIKIDSCSIYNIAIISKTNYFMRHTSVNSCDIKNDTTIRY